MKSSSCLKNLNISSIVDELFRRGVNRLASAVAVDYLEKRAKVVSSFAQFTQRHRPVGRQ